MSLYISDQIREMTGLWEDRLHWRVVIASPDYARDGFGIGDGTRPAVVVALDHPNGVDVSKYRKSHKNLVAVAEATATAVLERYGWQDDYHVLAFYVREVTGDYPEPPVAQGSDLGLSALEDRVQNLVQRVAALEALPAQRDPATSTEESGALGDWRDRLNWRFLRKGMTKQQVELLLGDPPKISANAVLGDTWHYPDALGGSVQFNDHDRLEAWREP